MSYTKHGKGAAGVRSTRGFGDFGLEELRRRDSRIIESLKLQKAEETERSKNLISQQREVDRTELGVKEDIQQLKQDYFQNALAATKLRGRQEGQKGKDQARMIKEDAQPIIRMWEKIAGATGNIAGAAIEKSIENRIAKNTSKNYDNATDALDVGIWKKISQMQLRTDLAQADKGKAIDLIWANEFVGKSPKIIQGKSLRGATLAAIDQTPSILQNTLQELSLGKVLLTPESIQDSFDRRKQTIGEAFGFIDKNGDWITNEHVLDFQRTWNLKVQEVKRNFSHAKVLDLNTSNGNVFFDALTDDKNAENLFSSAFNWTLRPQDKDALSYHSMSDGYKETLIRAAGDKNFSRKDLETLLRSPWYISKGGKNFGKPNTTISKKTGKPQSISEKFPTLKEEVLKERTKWENQWKANSEAAAKEADRLDNEKVVQPLLKTYAGEDLSGIISEMESKHGTNSRTVTNLKLLQKASKSQWDSKLQLAQLEEAKKTMDHDFLIAMRHSSELSGEARRAWNEKYLPLLGPLKRSGFSSKSKTEQHKNQAMRLLKHNTVKSGVTPETLDAVTIYQDALWWEKYESLTTGQNARYAPGSEDAIGATDKFVTQTMENLEIISSGDRKGKGPAEFAMFLPGGVSWKDSEKYSISNQEYQQRVKSLGQVEAAKSDGVVSKEHIQYAARQIASGKPFEPLPFTANIKGLTRQEFYQHHIDKLGLKTKIVVPEDFKSSVKKEKPTVYDLSLKRQIEHVRTINGFWQTLTTEAEGTRPKGPADNRVSDTVKSSVDSAIKPNTSTVGTGHEVDNTNPDLSFEPGSDGLSVLSFVAKRDGLNLLELKTQPTYYGDNIEALPGSNFEKWLFNSDQNQFFFVANEVPGNPGYWRHRT